MGYVDRLRRQQEAAYEDVLAQEGLAVIESHSFQLDVDRVRAPMDATRSDAVALWLAWAGEVLEVCPFRERGPGIPSRQTRRRVWRLYASGRPLSEIAAESGVSKQKVKVAIRVTKDETGIPEPVQNPWLRRRGAEESDMTEAKRRPEPVEYSRVELKGELKIPGIPTTKSTLMPMKGHNGVTLPLMGTPHVGGIDFELPTTHNGRKTITIITVPWQSIKQAEQAPEDWTP